MKRGGFIWLPFRCGKSLLARPGHALRFPPAMLYEPLLQAVFSLFSIFLLNAMFVCFPFLFLKTICPPFRGRAWFLRFFSGFSVEIQTVKLQIILKPVSFSDAIVFRSTNFARDRFFVLDLVFQSRNRNESHGPGFPLLFFSFPRFQSSGRLL